MTIDNSCIVYIVDDDAAVRDSLNLLCDSAGLKPECHASGESFLAAYNPMQPGCLVLDVRMSRMSGTELHTELNRLGSLLPVIYLTAYGDIPLTVWAMKAGATDFLTKPVDAIALLDCIYSALQQSLLQRTQIEKRAKLQQCLTLLTPRETEIMTLALSGHANKVIANHLDISYRTVELHRSRILQKTQTENLLELTQLLADCNLTPALTPALASPPVDILKTPKN
jgi:FixJ family two-component response regulator